MCVHWYFTEHFSELRYRFFSKSKGRFFDELRVSFKEKKLKKFVNMAFFYKTKETNGATKKIKVKDCFRHSKFDN